MGLCVTSTLTLLLKGVTNRRLFIEVGQGGMERFGGVWGRRVLPGSSLIKEELHIDWIGKLHTCAKPMNLKAEINTCLIKRRFVLAISVGKLMLG